MTEEVRDCYRVLDLNPPASLTEIKGAYRDQLKAWHPDRFPNDPSFQRKANEKTKQINHAYQTIKAYLRAAEEEGERGRAEADRRAQEEEQEEASQEAEARASEQGDGRAEQARADAAEQAGAEFQAEASTWKEQWRPEEAGQQEEPPLSSAPSARGGLGLAGRRWLAGFGVAACIVLLLVGVRVLFQTSSQEPLSDIRVTPTAPAIDSSPSPAPSHPPIAPAAATTENPFVNSLGMKFVPVPAEPVLFGIWDVRVQDYQAFVRDTGRGWLGTSEFEQGATHPVVNVSRWDAKAFCVWLTKREQNQGLLNSRQSYRLPTNWEWEGAVGLENKDVYPWGSKWPPPEGVGNYAQSLGVDSFEHTSPVGSFKANRLGLYDVEGNVWQWCEDYGLRGASWANGEPDHLLSSYSLDRHYDHADSAIGFRCVLVLQPP